MNRSLIAGIGLIAAAVLGANIASAAAPEPGQVKRATDKCGNWLVEQFDRGDKVFGKGDDAKKVTTVAIAVLALCESPRDYKESNGPFVSEPVKYLLSRIKKDGSIKTDKEEESLEALVLTIAALKSTKNDKHNETIALLEKHQKEAFSHGLPVPDLNKMEYLTSINATRGSLHSIFIAVLHLGDTKEMSIDGQPVKWGPVIAEALLKHQQKDGSFGDDVRVNAMALAILNKCYKAMK